MDKFNINENLTFADAKSLFDRMMRALSKKDKTRFLSYIEDEWNIRELSVSSGISPAEHKKGVDRGPDVPPIIKMIMFDIKARMPFDAILPTENIKAPEKGENADCDPIATMHVDGFLYDDDEVDTLIDTGKLQNNYCGECGSKNIKPSVIISHSSSYRMMEYVFHNLLPALNGKTVLDIGSRLGAVLYGAYVLTGAEKIIGVEMNADLCKLQTDLIKKYNMNDRIEVVNKKIEDCPEIVQSSDVIIMNNAFEFYVSESVHKEIWKFLRANIKKGTILVTRPQIDETFKYLDTGIILDEWVKPYVQCEQERGQEDAIGNLIPESLDYPDIGCYEVLQ